MKAGFLKRVKRMDTVARWFISLGGVSIIASMLIMIVFMVNVTLPLFQEPSHDLVSNFQLKDMSSPLMIATGPYLERGCAISRDGRLLDFSLVDGELGKTFELEKPEPDAAILDADRFSKEDVGLFWSDGTVSVIHFSFSPKFDEHGKRTIHLRWEQKASITAYENISADSLSTVRMNDEGLTTLARVVPDNGIFLVHSVTTEDFMGDITSETFEQTIPYQGNGKITALTVDRDGRRLFVGDDHGMIYTWNLGEPGDDAVAGLSTLAFSGSEAVASMYMAFGDISVLIGGEKGSLSAWNYRNGDPDSLHATHRFPKASTQIDAIVPSMRDKSFATLSHEGSISLRHLTSERELIKISSAYPIRHFSLAERGDGLLALDNNGTLWLWSIHMEHPEISWKTLWGKVWYESYEEPQYAWQSSSASDDFEPKLSLVPLIFGSLKGTFYGMLLSFPLALMAAIYTSHIMHPKWRAIVKPTIELMAAIPTVVIGFLGALWLAPKFESNVLALLFSLGFIPLSVAIGMAILMRDRKRKITGYEFLWATPLILIGCFLSYHIGLMVQNTYFGGNVNLWLFQAFDMSVDQRNCVVIAFALGFAVIPIIFTISEDALYNVPKHQTAAALALGSSRWQTVRRVILPMASPGIFAATMIGFGRAVGETMIVLMATGNTPIMSPSIFNGMRTLSANIAVEIPEAPVGSSLFRLLFLSAVILFIMTAVVNTLAEVVRVRLAKKYKSL